MNIITLRLAARRTDSCASLKSETLLASIGRVCFARCLTMGALPSASGRTRRRAVGAAP